MLDPKGPDDPQGDEDFLRGGSEMAKLIRSTDWSDTPLGPVAGWPQSLRTTVSLCLGSQSSPHFEDLGVT